MPVRALTRRSCVCVGASGRPLRTLVWSNGSAKLLQAWLGFREEGSWPRVEGGWKKPHERWLVFCCPEGCLWQRRPLDRGGLLPPLLLAAKREKGMAAQRGPSDPTWRTQRLSRPCSEGVSGRDVRGAADRRGSAGRGETVPGEGTVPASSCRRYRQQPLPSQGRAACLNLRCGLQETLPVWETVAAAFCALPCGRLSFAVQLTLSLAAAAPLPRSLLMWFLGAKSPESVAQMTCLPVSPCPQGVNGPITKPSLIRND